MTAFLTYLLARILDVLTLVTIVYATHKYVGSEMTMNIEDPGNLCFVLTLSFTSFFAGASQAKFVKK
jgi:hypothetical protein